MNATGSFRQQAVIGSLIGQAGRYGPVRFYLFAASMHWLQLLRLRENSEVKLICESAEYLVWKRLLAITDTWLILPVVISLSQRLSHACLSMNNLL